MADLLMLKNNNESSTIDLLAGTYKLRDRSWLTSTPSPTTDFKPVEYGSHPAFQNFEPQVETLDLIAQDTTHTNITAAQQTITDALEAARIYNQHNLWTISTAFTGTNPWWLHWNIDGETEKRSLLYEGEMASIGESCANPFISSDVSLLRMALKRHPFWEPRATGSQITATTTISAFGGTHSFTNIDGNVWARLFQVQLYGKGGSGPIYRTWVGIREKMAGTTNFEPIWDLEDGTNDPANGAIDSTARGSYHGSGHVRKVSPAATLTRYLSMTVDQVCAANGHADYAHQIGEYLVLCRCTVDSGTVGLQMRYGFDNSDVTMPCDEVFIDNTNWRLIELGRIQIPPTGGDPFVTGTYARYTMIEIYAEQVSGNSTLDLDALVMIPAHHFWQTVGGAVGTNATNASVIITAPNDKYYCYGWTSYYPRLGLEYNVKDWYLPTGDSIAVVAGERETQHVLSDDMGFYVIYYPRWSMYR